MSLRNPIFVFLLLASSLFVASPVLSEGGPAKIFVPQKKFNFGVVRQGEVVEKNFIIENRGEADLEILKVHADCGCTAAEPESRKIRSGESTHILLSFDTTGFQGQKVKTVRVYTNDPVKRSISLALKGEIKKEIEVSPARISFGNLTRSKTKDISKTVKIKISNNEAISIKNIVSRSKFLEVERVSDKEFSVSLVNTVPLGVFRGNVAVRTTSKNTPIVNVPVFAMLTGDLFFKPSDLSFGLLEGPLKEKVSKKVLLLSNSTKQVNILSAKTESKKVAVSFEERKDEGGFELEVTLLESLYGTLHSKVVVVTDHEDPEQRTIELPVYGIISDKGA